MFQPTWTSSSNTQYVQNAWEEIVNINFYKSNEIIFTKYCYYFIFIIFSDTAAQRGLWPPRS
jgi:hypothetical protein